MEGRRRLITAELEPRHASRRQSSRRLSRARCCSDTAALIYCPGVRAVSALPERPLVLLVEDDRDGRLLFSEWLSDAGFRVETAHNGLQALERAREMLPDAILTDLHLPGIDGYELTRRLKSDPQTGGVPVLAVTGYAPFAQDSSRADRAGCDAFLPKPCDPEDVITTLHALIAEARGRRTA